MANSSSRPIKENFSRIQTIVGPNIVHHLRVNLCKQFVSKSELGFVDVSIPQRGKIMSKSDMIIPT